MRVHALVFTLALAGAPFVSAQDAENPVLKKLDDIRRMRSANEYRRRVAVLPFTSQAARSDIGNVYAAQAHQIFGHYNYEMVPLAESYRAAAGHDMTRPYTIEELARLSDQLKVERLVVGNIRDFQAHRKLGLPLPMMWTAVEFHVSLDAGVYRRSLGRIEWQDAYARHHRHQLGGGYMTRDEARENAGGRGVEKMFLSYLNGTR